MKSLLFLRLMKCVKDPTFARMSPLDCSCSRSRSGSSLGVARAMSPMGTVCGHPRRCSVTKPNQVRSRTQRWSCPSANRPSGGTTVPGPTRRCMRHSESSSSSCCDGKNRKLVLKFNWKKVDNAELHLLGVVITEITSVPVTVTLTLTYQFIAIAVVSVAVSITLPYRHWPLVATETVW